ncbi:hypothetical protein BDN72DRAFT_879898 [Pluteus cervinus]|uniref:Uncharacterized protein n=1 Tax=Pluteus cervinus TaxID=181527 RepID=A0ACD3AMB9_9AGAR|nr:hypothetical protein BDN72DRAFT_879898 [Pluteus cervinus]
MASNRGRTQPEVKKEGQHQSSSRVGHSTTSKNATWKESAEHNGLWRTECEPTKEGKNFETGGRKHNGTGGRHQAERHLLVHRLAKGHRDANTVNNDQPRYEKKSGTKVYWARSRKATKPRTKNPRNQANQKEKGNRETKNRYKPQISNVNTHCSFHLDTTHHLSRPSYNPLVLATPTNPPRTPTGNSTPAQSGYRRTVWNWLRLAPANCSEDNGGLIGGVDMNKVELVGGVG